jgi:hypothetical protein
MKAISMTARSGHEESLSDRLDLHRLLRAFPQLRADESIVATRMRSARSQYGSAGGLGPGVAPAATGG